ncbi:hypothetical protein [uncultured Cellulomonas sp.]|uniref:hypothetical protein n=1 Tax=uncultured Cellulomonas sp. TaxID=189682 RepID=UPI00260C127F|nr:hypothetical protein [uncultured Cellulomonas sp.]
MAPTDVYGSTPGRVLTAATAVAAVALVAALAPDVGPRDLVLAASLAALAVLGVWATLGRPCVEVSDGTVVLRNVTRTVTLPWPTVVGVEVGWSLVVRSTHGRWTAWAAPRGSTAVRGPRRGVRDDERSGAGRRRPATAQVVAAEIDERLASLRAAGHLDDAQRLAAAHGITPGVRWHTGTLASAAALVAVAVATRVI